MSDMLLMPICASATGFVLAGTASCKPTADAYMKLHTNTKYTSAVTAQQDLNNAVLKEFGRNGTRVGWRVGLFAGMFSVLSLGFEKTRDRRDVLNLVPAGAISGGLMRTFDGPRQMALGAAIGSGLSLGYGLVLQGLWMVDEEIAKQKDKHGIVTSVPAVSVVPVEPDVAGTLDRLLDNYDKKEAMLTAADAKQNRRWGSIDDR